MTSTLKTETPRSITPLGILVEQLEQIVKMAETAEISAELSTAIKEAYQLAAGIDPYIQKNTTQESEVLAALAKKTRQEPWNLRFSNGETVGRLQQEMLSGNIEGQTLKMFVYMAGAKRILEIGMFTGYSALAMAEGLPEDGRIVACEVDQYVADFAKSYFEKSTHGSKISVEVAPALETMQKLADAGEYFDLVFIDADKKEYIKYFRMLLDTQLLAANGFICVDNTLFDGQVYLPPEKRTANGEAIAQFNRFVAEDSRVEQVILPLRDGVTIIRRK